MTPPSCGEVDGCAIDSRVAKMIAQCCCHCAASLDDVPTLTIYYSRHDSEVILIRHTG